MLPADEAPGPAHDIYRGRFERCFRDRHVQLLAFTLRWVSGREVVKDVVADTFAVAWRRRACIPDGPLPWLYAITANVMADQYRSARRRHDLPGRRDFQRDDAEERRSRERARLSPRRVG